jgi:plastocyanin
VLDFPITRRSRQQQCIAYAAAIALSALSTPPSEAQPRPAPVSDGETITVQLSNFDFTPEHLRLKAGVPVRLRLANVSGGGHDFSAPAFFAASGFPPGVAAPQDGTVSVGSHQMVEITVVPRMPGTYHLECSHFLHSLFEMHGTIEVTP